MSPTPVRAGPGQLQRDSFVEVSATGRAYVSRLTREDFEEICAARLGLEGLAAALGAPAVDDEGLRSMRDGLERLREFADRQDVDEYLALR